MRRFLSVPNLLALACCLLFAFLGCLWLSDVGIETDEALFSAAIYPPYFDPVRVFHVHLPLMVMNYVGGLKGWLYIPLLQLFPPSPELVRVPMVLLGALTIWLFYRLMRRAANLRAALIATALLATDPLFLLTTRWDWGPVAIQHFCAVAAALCLVRHLQSPSPLSQAGGFFLLGLGLWDKGTFLWLLAAGGLAAILVFPRELWRAVTWRHALLAVCCFCLGAAPLLKYNAKYDWVTFRGNAAWTTNDVDGKAGAFQRMMQGQTMAGFAVRGEEPETAAKPGTWGRQLVVDVNGQLGTPDRSLQWFAFVASLLLLPFFWRQSGRLTLFSILFLLTGFCLMAFTERGGAIHHLILLWPAPQALIGAAFAGIAGIRRPVGLFAAGLLTIGVAASNLAVLNNYLAQQIVNGSSALFTDAAYQIPEVAAAMGAERLYLLDWDFCDNTRLFVQGRRELVPVSANLSADQLRTWLTPPEKSGGFIWHTPAYEMQPETAAAFRKLLASGGFQKYDERLLRDRNGRAIIEMFRVRLLQPPLNP